MRQLVVKTHDIYAVLSQNLNPSTELITRTGVPTTRMERSLSIKQFATYGILVAALSLPLLIFLCLLHNRVREEDEAEGVRTQDAAEERVARRHPTATTAPKTKPPTCAHQAMPATSCDAAGGPSERKPLKNCMPNQTGRKIDGRDLRHGPVNDQREERDDPRRAAAAPGMRRAMPAMLPDAPIDGIGRVREEHRVREAPHGAAGDVEDEVAHVPERVLDRPAEDPEIDHVADEMHEPAVQKERRHQRDRHFPQGVVKRRRMQQPRRE